MTTDAGRESEGRAPIQLTRRSFVALLVAPLLPPSPPATLTLMNGSIVSFGLLSAPWINDSTYRSPYLGIDRSGFSN